MASLFGMTNGYEQVGETPAAYQPPGSRNKSNALDLKQLQEGIASAAQGAELLLDPTADQAGQRAPHHTWCHFAGHADPRVVRYASGTLKNIIVTLRNAGDDFAASDDTLDAVSPRCLLSVGVAPTPRS